MNRSSAGLAFEALERHRVARERDRQKLQRQRAAEPRVRCLVDNAHAAGANLLEDAVV
jgi:hypothetical protein